MDKVICAHYEGNFVVDHECQHGVMSGTAAESFKEVDAKSYREACHKDVCLQHKGRLMFCLECEQRYSPMEIIRATCAKVRNNATVSEAPKKSTVRNVENFRGSG